MQKARLSKHIVNFNYGKFGYSYPFYSALTASLLYELRRIFDKTTNRYFETGKIAFNVEEAPTWGSGYILPPYNFNITVWIMPSLNVSGVALHRSDGGTDIVIGIPPENLVTDVILRNTLIHEIGHSMGAALGEYYYIQQITDLTLSEPTLKVALLNPADDYWSQRLRWRNDPMLRPLKNADPTFGELSSFLINYGVWREFAPMPDISKIGVQAKYQNMPYKVWRMSRSDQSFLQEGITNNRGQFILDWGCNQWEATSDRQFVKVVIAGRAYGLSIFDVQLAWLKECEVQGLVGTICPADLAYFVAL